MAKLRLSVLDQSPIHDGGTAVDALRDTLRLARACDAWGYHRYWLAEHHDLTGYAGTCPEILMAHVAQQTARIRVGSGGVMLNHYAPFKVAETFSMLAALHPGRIDLGVGRAPGGDGNARNALAWPNRPTDPQLYAQQVQDLIGFLHDDLAGDHPFAALHAVPRPPEPPELWLLGSDGGSSKFAGSIGAGFALALFIGSHPQPETITANYRTAFKPSVVRDRPAAAIATAVVCADTLEAAREVASSTAYWRVRLFRHGRLEPLLPPEAVARAVAALDVTGRDQYEANLTRMVVGDAASCRSQLEALAATHDVDEVFTVTVCYRFEDRLQSYRLLAEEFSGHGEVGSTVRARAVAAGD